MTDLGALAQGFAADLTASVRAVVGPSCSPFKAIAMSGGAESTVSVIQEPATGIPMTVDGLPLLVLTAAYRCTWDHKQTFLTVESSDVKGYASDRAQGEPLFRYEYLRQVNGGIPGAHIQIHGHRDALTYVMTRSGEKSQRGKDRSRRVQIGQHPRMSELHFPVGGSRMRPCLEDVLQMLVLELGVDTQEGWLEVLEGGREKWRRSQVSALVRDAPAEAVATLQDLGYTITAPEQVSERTARLRDL